MRGIKEYKRAHVEEYGEQGMCLSCGTTDGYKAPHHIIRRARLSRHPERDNWRNLIMLCQECHAEFDQFKREEEVSRLIEERQLNKLFKPTH